MFDRVCQSQDCLLDYQASKTMFISPSINKRRGAGGWGAGGSKLLPFFFVEEAAKGFVVQLWLGTCECQCPKSSRVRKGKMLSFHRLSTDSSNIPTSPNQDSRAALSDVSAREATKLMDTGRGEGSPSPVSGARGGLHFLLGETRQNRERFLQRSPSRTTHTQPLGY